MGAREPFDLSAEQLGCFFSFSRCALSLSPLVTKLCMCVCVDHLYNMYDYVTKLFSPILRSTLTGIAYECHTFCSVVTAEHACGALVALMLRLFILEHYIIPHQSSIWRRRDGGALYALIIHPSNVSVSRSDPQACRCSSQAATRSRCPCFSCVFAYCSALSCSSVPAPRI
jgi:hypothetical protein